ncbi:MAG: hypothetical protein AB4206_17755 [Xenococcaceae cyanobacterium]
MMRSAEGRHCAIAKVISSKVLILIGVRTFEQKSREIDVFMASK